MSRLLALVFWISATAALAGGIWVGPPVNSGAVNETQRIGPSALAEGPIATLDAFAEPFAAKAILLYVDQVHAPGTVTVRARAFDTPDAGPLASSSVLISAPGWYEWPLAPAVLGHFVVELVPELGCEISLGHLRQVSSSDPQTGLDLSPGPAYAFRGAWLASAVFRLEGVPDRFGGSSGCGPGELDGVSGFPYVRFRELPIAAGQTQSFFWPTMEGEPKGIYTLETYPWGPTVLTVFAPDGSTAFSDASLGRTYFDSRQPVFPIGDGGTSETFDFQLTDDGGMGTWFVYDTGAVPIGPCHPAVRATFGGHRARAMNQPPGTDFAFRVYGLSVHYGFEDLDHDGFTRADSGYWGRGGVPESAIADCNDAFAFISPASPEACNGFDDDCDGLVDADDQLVTLPRCDNQRGACAGSIHAPGECSSGRWGVCAPGQYGPDYSTKESLCDGIDNDCNGRVDEDLEGLRCERQLGVCTGKRAPVCAFPAAPLCTSTEYGPDFEVSETRCDGLDNDCDGLTDDADPDLAPMQAMASKCALQQGVCAGSTQTSTCSACEAANYGAHYEPTEQSCDGLDNDCDGLIDEGCSSVMTVPTEGPAAPRPCGCNSNPGGAIALLALCRYFRRPRPAARSRSAAKIG